METIDVRDQINFDDAKPVIRTLLPGPGPRVVLLCLRGGQEIPVHTAANAITVQALSGHATFYDGPDPVEMKSGMLLRLEAGRPHAVTAREDSALVVTILAPPANLPADKGVLDLREIPRPQRHALVFDCLTRLPVGETFTLVNDHDPLPLRNQMEMRFPGESAWEYEERGPETFRIRITRIKQSRASQSA
ncbi:MAG TPA: DUF2249 domain-containing protein [Bryobacteraceae bacterium]|jgi:uncharacterized protein (DUF2249 family)